MSIEPRFTLELTVVVPVYNEEGCLPELYRRLADVVAGLGLQATCEMVFVDDGSEDRSRRLLEELATADERVKPVFLSRNRGQFHALLEGLRRSLGRYVVTLDADLQNPPEEIPRVLTALRTGHDLVTTRRRHRRDPLFRKVASRFSNRLSSWIAGTKIPDHGCMLCGFDRDLVRRMCGDASGSIFLQALALGFAKAPASFDVEHAPRFQGKSRYNLTGLVKLQLGAALAFRRMRRQWRREAARDARTRKT